MFKWTPKKALSWSEPVRVRHTFYPSGYLKSWMPAAITGAMLLLWLLLWLFVTRPGEPAYQGFIFCVSFGLVSGRSWGTASGRSCTLSQQRSA